MRWAIVALILAALSIRGGAQTTDKEWQAKAVEKYPELAVKDSELNKRFIEAYNERRSTDPAFLRNPRWPLLLADEVADAVTADGKSHATRGLFTSLLAIVVAGLIGIVILLPLLKAAKLRKRKSRIRGEAREYMAAANDLKALPAVPTNLMLKPDESAFYSEPSILCETRAVRHYQSGHAGVRVAKGLYIGGSQGRSVSNQEWAQIDTGTLTITNKRLIFDGPTTDRNVAINKIFSAESSLDGVEVSVDGRQKSMGFTATNPQILAIVIRVCSQGDPFDLSQTRLNFTIG